VINSNLTFPLFFSNPLYVINSTYVINLLPAQDTHQSRSVCYPATLPPHVTHTHTHIYIWLFLYSYMAESRIIGTCIKDDHSFDPPYLAVYCGLLLRSWCFPCSCSAARISVRASDTHIRALPLPSCMPFTVCLRCVLLQRDALLLCDWCIYVLHLIIVPMAPVKNLFAIKIILLIIIYHILPAVGCCRSYYLRVINLSHLFALSLLYLIFS
jgi:hypothetical protein